MSKGEHNFKVGDWIRCVDVSGASGELTLFDVYQITDIIENSHPYDDFIKVRMPNGEERSWFPWRFMSTEAENPKVQTNPIQETPSNLVVNSEGGMKLDGGKIDYTLLLQDLKASVDSVVRVLEFGAGKYGRSNYSKVEQDRYEKALLRHMMQHLAGEEFDSDTGEPHMSHIVCSALFIAEKLLKKEQQSKGE